MKGSLAHRCDEEIMNASEQACVGVWLGKRNRKRATLVGFGISRRLQDTSVLRNGLGTVSERSRAQGHWHAARALRKGSSA